MRVDDNDSCGPPGVELSTGDLIVSEGGSASYTVALESQPTFDVRVMASRQSGSAGIRVSPARLTFTPTNWDMPQTFTVAAAQDDNENHDRAVFAHVTDSADATYANFTGPSITVTQDDDDVAIRLTCSPHDGEPLHFSLTTSTFPARAGINPSCLLVAWVTPWFPLTSMGELSPDCWAALYSRRDIDTRNDTLERRLMTRW